MKKTPPKNTHKPVANIVHQIMENARTARADGPFSGLFGRDAQVSSALTQAGTMLAKLDRAAPPKRSSLMQNLWGAPQPEKPRRSWFFFGGSKTESAVPDAKRIEELLRLSALDGRRLVLDRDVSEGRGTSSDIDCTLPEGAEDPVCMPRKG
jgi:hypothetical protein